MKKIFILFLGLVISGNVLAATRDSGRVINNSATFGTQGAQQGNPGLYRAGVNVKNVTTNVSFSSDAPGVMTGNVGATVQNSYAPSVAVANLPVADGATGEEVVQAVQKTQQQLQIEKQRDICVRNNIGIGNTFVWAARNSNLSNYSTMIEDVNTPENNTCFVKVSINSTDGKIKVSDLESKYFEMGQVVTCGSWVDEDMLEKRILDAKKSARTWGVVASTVGGAAVGVGAMELFGNKLIGGSVQGQKALEGQELLISQLKVLKKENQTEYDRVVRALKDLEEYCNKSDVWSGAEMPADCISDENPFIGLLDQLN